MTQVWTVELVAARFAEAAATARRLRSVRVQGYFNSWPEFRREPWEAFANDDCDYRPLPPSPAAVDRMLEVSRWLQWLDVDQRQLIWMRARGDGWKEVSRRFACNRSTAWRRWQVALSLICRSLADTHSTR